jgi:hypothetical protein
MTQGIFRDERLQSAMTQSRAIEALRGPAQQEAAPRRPDDVTAQTARRTALDR